MFNQLFVVSDLLLVTSKMIEEEVAMEVCDEDEHLDDESCFNAAEATENYRIAGSRVECDTSKVTRVRFGHLYDPDVDILVKQVLNEIEFVNKLSEAQEIFLHTIGSKKDLFALLNTGAGGYWACRSSSQKSVQGAFGDYCSVRTSQWYHGRTSCK